MLNRCDLQEFRFSDGAAAYQVMVGLRNASQVGSTLCRVRGVVVSGRGRLGRRRGGPGGATMAAPRIIAHAVGAQVSGTGITLSTALPREHDSGRRSLAAFPRPQRPTSTTGDLSEDARRTELDGRR